ncbi:MAG: transglutaminase domain-containing protein [bacterium]|nr:transglutaminase domain-containing protein [bacterium]
MHDPTVQKLQALVFSILLSAASAVPSGAAAPAPESSSQERWYRIELAGSPAGWLVERQERSDDRLTTESMMHLDFKRGPAEASLELESRFVETPEGRAITVWAKQKLGSLPMETSYEFLADGIAVTQQQGDAVQEQKLPLPEGEWLTPGRMESKIREMLGRGVKEFSLRTIDPLLGPQPVTTEWTLEARDEEIVAGGRPYRTTRWRQTQSLTPQLATIVNVGADGRMIRSTTQMMGMEIAITLASREVALGKREAPELLLRTFIQPDRRIESPRRVTRAVYELSVVEGELPQLPTVGSQRVEHAGQSARITVALGSSPAATEVDAAEFLRASIYVNHDDPRIRELLAEATRGAKPDPAARVAAIRSFVGEYLNDKDLQSVLATASEVAATRSGDCTEHSVLATALLRAAGIPARVVTGVVYVERFAGRSDLFGYHMWAQALVEDRWLDLDPTLGSFDATHIAFDTTALNDDASAMLAMANFASMIGRVRIKVLEIEPRAVGHPPP